MGINKKVPLISIAMATYNGEKYLEEQLNSIFKQSYPNIEVIVTDDCSQDRTVEILDNFSKSDNLNYFVNSRKLGFVKNFEKAVSFCTGEYIALSDQDDIWFPHKLELLIDNIDHNMLIFSDAMICDSNGSVIAQTQNNVIDKNKEGIPENGINLFTRLLYSNFVTGCTILMHREVCKLAHPIPDGIIFHDWWYALCASSLGSIHYCRQPLIKYRQHNDNEIGLLEPHKNLKKFFLFFDKKYFKYRKKVFRDYELQLESIYSLNRFNREQSKQILDIKTFFRDKRTSIFHWKAFFLSYKYRRHIYFEDSRYIRYLRCFRCLIL